MRTITKATIVLIALLILSNTLPLPGEKPVLAQEPTDQDDVELLQQLQQVTNNQARVSFHQATGKVRFISMTPDQAVLPATTGLAVDASPEAVARAFFSDYGPLFGLTDPQRELTLLKVNEGPQGRSSIRLQQHYQGVPVLGAELIVQLDATKRVLAAAGEVSPDIAVDVTPTVTAGQAQQTALAAIGKAYLRDANSLIASQPELWIYHPVLLGGPGLDQNRLVWRLEVTGQTGDPIRELVLVDAHLGNVALHFNQLHAAKNRQTHTANNGTNLPGILVCNEIDPTCSLGDDHAQAAHIYAGDTYDFYFNEHGRDSIDDEGLTLVSTVHYDSDYENAFWNGAQMIYGDGSGYPLADDVVAHELTHGVTQYTSNLFYFYQSGAINESLSDVWGEFVDLTNGKGTDTLDVRWLLGEDISGLGAIRDMADPPAFDGPDKMSSPQYYCNQSDLATGSGDNGGVHINSGVNNKAVYLMVDGSAAEAGGTFNGFAISGIGISKVADLYYEVQTHWLTSAADYNDLYDSLLQAAITLGYSPSDQAEIKKALDAVEMNQLPANCPALEAAICDTGLPQNLFFDNIEAGDGNWTIGSNIGSTFWYIPQTSSSIGLVGPYAADGVGNIWGFDQGNVGGPTFGSRSDTFTAMNEDVSLPANAFLHFEHAFGFESHATFPTYYDGGVLEYNTNGGDSWIDAGALPALNGYNGTLLGGSSNNPLAGRDAFVADSRGYGSSRYDLSSLAGEDVRFRFRIGTDTFLYDYGWFIDNVRIYTCDVGNTPPHFLGLGLSDLFLTPNATQNKVLDLWTLVEDDESPVADLTFSFCNAPEADLMISISANRFVDVSPNASWDGETTVCIRATDPGGMSVDDTFTAKVVGSRFYLPLLFAQ